MNEGEKFFEVGFGSLLLSVLASKMGATSIKGSELDPNAIELANINAERNGIDDYEFFDTDLFPEGMESQDVIVANVPQTPKIDGEENIHIDAGVDGTEILRRVLDAAPDRLAEGGRMYICVASIANAERVLAHIEAMNFEARALGHQELPIPPYVKQRLESPRFKYLVDKGEIFQKEDGDWYSRDTLYELKKR